MAFDWNTWARNINQQRGQPYAYLLGPQGGSSSVIDPAFDINKNPAYRQKVISGFEPPTVAGTMMTTSRMPGAGFYSPEGKSWQEITPGMLSNPEFYGKVAKMPSMAGLLAKAPAGAAQAYQKTSGSQHSLGADVLNKMWR